MSAGPITMPVPVWMADTPGRDLRCADHPWWLVTVYTEDQQAAAIASHEADAHS